jgi:two-component system, OmpR family, phosphate regulon sensor histidine kinase PhoR
MSAHRHQILSLIPRVAVAGFIALIVMALVPLSQPYVLTGALVVTGSVLLYGFRELSQVREQVRQDLLPEILTKVQPEGPSYQGVLRAMPDPVMVISGYEPNDLAGRWIVFANEAAMELFHIRCEGGLLVSSMRHPEVLEAVDEALFGNLGRDIIYETSGAQTHYWRAFTAPLPLEDEEKHLALLVIRDETDTRRTERMRADFLANASHELRSPLASLIGFIETLRGHAKDDPVVRDKFLTIMGAQAERMGRLITDLLSLSRIEMNEHVPPSGEADLVHSVREVVEGMTILARERQVIFTVSGPKPGLFPIKADRDQIMQVLQNLIDNALKYAPCGSDIHIEIKLNQTFEQAAAGTDTQASKLVLLRPDRDRDEFYTLVRIRDQGPGISRQYLPRLAERFYRVEGQKSGDRLGTGLGLAIVKHIVNRHRGGLVVESLSTVTAASPSGLNSEGDRIKIAPLPVTPAPSFTAFSVYFPQKAYFEESGDGPRLVVTGDTATSVDLSTDLKTGTV